MRVSVNNLNVRVPRDLPQVATGILKITGVAAPECLSSRLDDRGTGAPGLIHHLVHLRFAADVVPEGEFSGARRLFWDALSRERCCFSARGPASDCSAD